MRVSESMITGNFLRNLSNSYNRLLKYQNQLSTGKKISRPSDDPVVAMMGMQYRTDLNHIEQYDRNLATAYKWMDSSDDALSEANDVLKRVYELLIEASNDTYEGDQRAAIGEEVGQLKEQLATI